MLKAVVLIKKRPDLAYDEFARYWTEVHAPIVTQLPGMRRFVQNVVDMNAQQQPAPFDGMAESWWDDLSSVRAIRDGEAYARMIADEENLIDRSATRTMLVREYEHPIRR
ncbi:MAG: EthD domain-containing protein [Maricaulaceae bacterium]|jgi:uncharacterized protein (TIGR02118 family)